MTNTLYAKHPTHHRCPGDTPVVHLVDHSAEIQARVMAERLAADRLEELGRLRVKSALAMQIVDDLACGPRDAYLLDTLIQRAREIQGYGGADS